MLSTTPGPGSGRLLSIREASALLGVNPTTLRHWADLGQVRTFRTPGGHRRFIEADVVRVLAESRPHTQAALPGLSGEGALAWMRRSLGARRPVSPGQLTELAEGEREEMRLLGRRLVVLASDYVARPRDRRRLAAEAREIGVHYGRTLAGHGTPFSTLLEAFLFFRHLLEEAVLGRNHASGERPSPARLLSRLLDNVLLAAVASYEATSPPPPFDALRPDQHAVSERQSGPATPGPQRRRRESEPRDGRSSVAGQGERRLLPQHPQTGERPRGRRDQDDV